MSNNEKFNALLNSCPHARQVYNALLAFAKPSLQQTDDVVHTDGENIIITTKKAEEIIPISRVQSFSLKEPGLAYGKIVFTTSFCESSGWRHTAPPPYNS